MNKYRLRETGHSSARYGNCECCGGHVTEICIQTRQERYSEDGWAQRETLFGHRDCLIRIRREEINNGLLRGALPHVTAAAEGEKAQEPTK